MTDEDDKPDRDDARPPAESADDDAMRALLKRAAQATAPAAAPSPDLLREVQKKIRTRSRGKFFADGWSTSQSRVSYALVAAVMLVIIAVAYFALGPVGISAH
jgi:hypothetical protein